MDHSICFAERFKHYITIIRHTQNHSLADNERNAQYTEDINAKYDSCEVFLIRGNH